MPHEVDFSISITGEYIEAEIIKESELLALPDFVILCRDLTLRSQVDDCANFQLSLCLR